MMLVLHAIITALVPPAVHVAGRDPARAIDALAMSALRSQAHASQDASFTNRPCAQVFLFNHSDRTLLGPLSAVSPGGMYLDEQAWARPGHRSTWPAQVSALRVCAWNLPSLICSLCNCIQVYLVHRHSLMRAQAHLVWGHSKETAYTCAATVTSLGSCQRLHAECAREQVRVAVHHPVIALQEKVFKPLIEAAYYSPKAFHFDLTKPETLSLLEAFTHRQVRARPPLPTVMHCIKPAAVHEGELM